jgi:WD40 repeat protein
VGVASATEYAPGDFEHRRERGAWDVATLEQLVTLVGHASAVSDITFSPDGSMIATSSKDATAILWDAQTGQELRRLLGHAVETQSVAFSSDGTLIATAGGDNTARVWDVSTGEELIRLPGSQAGSYGVAFGSQDGGAQLVVASNDGIVRTFVLPVEDVLGLANSRHGDADSGMRRVLHVDQCPVSKHRPLCQGRVQQRSTFGRRRIERAVAIGSTPLAPPAGRGSQ